MPQYTLMLEDHKLVRGPSAEQVYMAVRKMGGTTGPTFIQLKDENGSYTQAGGSGGRYRVESRDVWGEGFQHFLAASPVSNDRSNTTVYYRNTCTEGVHDHRRCPLNCTVANVLTLDDVLAIMVQYAATGTRSGQYLWDDVSDSWIEEEAAKFGKIQQIKPKASDQKPT